MMFMFKLSDVRLYKYYYNGKYLYGQGIKEPEIRLALESKLKLAENTLKPGDDNIGMEEVKNIAISKKILVKTHKFIKQNVFDHRFMDDEGFTHVRYKSDIVGIIDRVDEFRTWIDFLLKKDLILFELIDNIDQMFEIKTNRYEKVKKQYRRYNEATKLAEEIKELSNIIKLRLTRNFNTGWIVYHDLKAYPGQTYDEIKKAFDNAYEKIRKKLLSFCFDRIPYNDKWTMLEMIDAYMLDPDVNEFKIKEIAKLKNTK